MLIALLPASSAVAEKLEPERARRFLALLARDTVDLSEYHLPGRLESSRRLGITYEGVVNKFMIGYEMEPAIREIYLKRPWDFTIEIQARRDGYNILRLKLPEKGYERAFYFKGRYFVSPVYYFSRDFTVRESGFFRFFLEDTTIFHPDAAARLDSFVRQCGRKLGLGSEELELLGREKIDYVLCRDEASIEQLTGYHIRGMGVLSHDCVVTTFTCHFHEVVHLLVNYRLKHLPQRAHPFLGEGLATGLGGRGGKEPDVIMDLGYFLQGSGLVAVDSLLDGDTFFRRDAGLTYPLAGLYNRYLLDRLGVERYLGMYRKYSRVDGNRSGPWIIDGPDLERGGWSDFLAGYEQFGLVRAELEADEGETVYSSERSKVSFAGDWCLFEMEPGALVASAGPPRPGYRSSKFDEIVPEARYSGEKYLVLAGETEVSVYNLYTNNLAANFVSAFTAENSLPALRDSRVLFSVHSSVFDESPAGLEFRPLATGGAHSSD